MKFRYAFCVLCLSPIVAHAADYALDGGVVKFSAPDAWTPLMEKHDGDPQFLALQVPGGGAANALARITVTTQHVADAQAYQQFLDDQVAKARRLPGYTGGTAGNVPKRRYSALENKQKNDYVEYYAYRDGLGIQVRCVRPAVAPAAWISTFDAGCEAVAKDVIAQ
ncbi:MAG TPA: hypothetical protein VJ727_04330 [Rhodanobacteraceae bacterium]|nr:hypothetical protein [Rhodanobacteraceae bacterium]